MTHTIKIREQFADAIVSGNKTFEVRENDRGYQTGDYVRFLPLNNIGNITNHEIGEKLYRITYVLSGWGIEKGYVVFGIKEDTE